MNNSRLFQVKVFFIFFMALTIIISYNTLVQSQTQLPDLICTSLSFSPTELEPMEQINLTGYILNDGDAPTGQEFQCNFYLATRPDEVNYNYFVGWFMMHPLAAHSGDNFNIVGEIPSDVPPGYYYVQIGVNTYERIEESNYDNNGTSSTNQLHVLYKPLPNLVCNSLSFSPTEIKAGGPIMLSGSVTNAGDAATGSGFNVKFYLSNSPDDFDQNLLLDSFDMSSLNINETRNFNRTGAIPANANPGYYYVWINIDPNDQIAESGERDNDKRTDSQVHVVLIDPAQITVVAPNGGEIWNENTTYDIKWTSKSTSGLVAIYYSLDGGVTWREPAIYSSTLDDGSASWITPSVSADITTCRIKVQDASNSSIWDMSNANFTIKDVTPTGSIVVIQPNGGQIWAEGSSQEIKGCKPIISENK